MLIKAQNLVIEEVEKHDGSKKTQAKFIYNKQKYCNFSVTDYDYFNVNTKIDNCILIISISEKPYYYDMKYHHFIAKIIPFKAEELKKIQRPKCTFSIEPQRLGENLYEITGYTRCILRCVYETKGRFGITTIIKILTGSNDKQIKRHKMNIHSFTRDEETVTVHQSYYFLLHIPTITNKREQIKNILKIRFKINFVCFLEKVREKSYQKDCLLSKNVVKGKTTPNTFIKDFQNVKDTDYFRTPKKN